MTANRPLSSHRCYQIASKFRSKSSDSISNSNRKTDSTEKTAKHEDKTTKMKKSQTVSTGFESKPLQTTSTLRRRFSLFRLKRSFSSNENADVQDLQQIIEQLRSDLERKTAELKATKERLASQPTLAQALQFQTILNIRMEEMLRENDLLKKSIEELESFTQEKSKRKNVPFNR